MKAVCLLVSIVSKITTHIVYFKLSKIKIFFNCPPPRLYVYSYRYNLSRSYLGGLVDILAG